MTESRTFQLEKPHMTGTDIDNWQSEVKGEFKQLGIECPIVHDGIYGVATRSYAAALCHSLGMIAGDVMAKGVTPELRVRIRNRKLTSSERVRMDDHDHVQYRRRLRARFESASETRVHRPVVKILEDSWGYHPGVHDGLDVICPPDAVCFAMVKSKIIDVRSSGWWGKSPSGDVSKGDGIVQMEVVETVGPFIKGHHIGYGHNEKARVHVGQIVEAGEPVAHAGLAVAWHIHMMYNGGNTSKGIGNIDPRHILDYAVKHG